MLTGKKRNKRRVSKKKRIQNKMSSALRKLGLSGGRKKKPDSGATNISAVVEDQDDKTIEGLVCPICRTHHVSIAALKTHFEAYHSMDQKEVRSPPPPLPSSSEKDSEKDSEMDSEKKEVSSPPTEKTIVKKLDVNIKRLDENITVIDTKNLPIRVSLPLVAAMTCLGIVTLSRDDDEEEDDDKDDDQNVDFASVGHGVPWLNLHKTTSALTLGANLVTRSCGSREEADAILHTLRSSMNTNSVWIETLRDVLVGCGNVFSSSNTFVDDEKARFQIQRSKVFSAIGIGKTCKNNDAETSDSKHVIEERRKRRSLQLEQEKMFDDMLEECGEDDSLFGNMKLKMAEESPVVAIAREQRNAGLITNTELDLIIEKDRHFQRQALLDQMKTTLKREEMTPSPPSKPKLSKPSSDRPKSLKASWSPKRQAVFYEVQVGVQSTSGGSSSSWKTVGGTEKCEYYFQRLEEGSKYVCRIRCLTKSQHWSSYSLSSNAVVFKSLKSDVKVEKTVMSVKLKKIEDMGLLAAWNPISNALQYEVQVRQVASNRWRTVGGTSKSQYLIQGLDRNGRKYESRVRSLLESGSWTAFSDVSNQMGF